MASCMRRGSPQRARDLLLIVLAVTTGATDATAFERLGHVFTSVITGNLVLLGVSAARGDGRLAVFGGCALAGYAVGVLAAAPRRAQDSDHQPTWHPGATAALTVEFALLGVFAAGWELSGDRPGRTMQALLLVVAASAMGVQSTAVRRLGQMSTTYLTSTLTGLLEALRIRRWSDEHARSVGILIAALIGAAAATVLTAHLRAALPALQLVPLGIVVLGSRQVMDGQRDPATGDQLPDRRHT